MPFLEAGQYRVTKIPISFNTSGDNTLVAATGAGTRIRVINVVLISSGTVSVQFFSGAAGTSLSGALPLTAQVGFAPGEAPKYGYFDTGTNKDLVLNLNANTQVSGWLVYTTVKGYK